MDTSNNTNPSPLAPPQPVPPQFIPPSPTIVSPSQDTPPPPPGKNKLLKIILPVILAVVVLLVSTTIMYAYGVIPAGNKAFQESVSDFIQGIPFMPKTVKYVLKNSIKAHEKVTKVTIDASIAASSRGAISLTGLTNFDMQIKGPVDYTDPKKPLIALTANFAKELEGNFRSKDDKAYFRFTKLPTFLALLLKNFGMNSDMLLNKWFYFDIKPLDTQARKALDAQAEKDDDEITKKLIKDAFTALDDPQISKTIRMSNEHYDQLDHYHVHFAPTDEILDLYWEKYLKSAYPKTAETTKPEKLSKLITNFVMDSWIDTKTYLMQKTTITFTVKEQTSPTTASSLSILPTQTSDVSVSFALNLSDFGKEVPFVTPDNPVNFEDFIKTSFTLPTATGSSNLYQQQLEAADNTRRKSDVTMILNGVGQYAAYNNGVLPIQITTASRTISSQGADLCKLLVPTYLPSLPVDPALGDDKTIQLSACNQPYDTGYVIQKDAQGRVTVSAPKAGNQTPISVSR